MQISIVGTGSKGNCYVIQNDNEALIIECGVRFSEVKKALGFNLKKVVGALVSHCHLDHSKYIADFVSAGIDIYSNPHTFNRNAIGNSHRFNAVSQGKMFKVGNFKVMPFDLKHDVPCLGFLVEHPETGKFCFITDSYYCEYRFKGLQNIIVEANYCETILNQRLANGEEPSFLRDRVLQSHMSLQTCKEFLNANDLKQVVNIVLIHLSDRNSNAKRFEKEVKELTAKRVTVAENGTTIPFGLTTF